MLRKISGLSITTLIQTIIVYTVVLIIKNIEFIFKIANIFRLHSKYRTVNLYFILYIKLYNSFNTFCSTLIHCVILIN